MADLVGQLLPDLVLPSTSHIPVSLAHLIGLTVLFIYPWTGKPDYPNPENWDHIPGAHGSTPQSLAYSEASPEFLHLGVKCFGVSQLDKEWQQDFASRNQLAMPLLSDAAGDLGRALGLQYITTGGKSYLKRRTLLAKNRQIVFDRVDVAPPEGDAAFMLAYLRNFSK